MTDAYINEIATAVPDYDVHKNFVNYAPSMLTNERERALLSRMAGRAQIEHRYSFLKPPSDPTQFDEQGFYKRGAFPDTQARMHFYERHALTLAKKAIDQLDLECRKNSITHLILTTCTGFYAPGLDLQVIEHYGLKSSTERTVIGFMGCNAAINALKLSRHIVRSEPSANVLILNLELCTLHLQETDNIEQLLSFLIFADGCSASLVSATPVGIEMQSFVSAVMPDSSDQITWHIGDLGFDMVLMGKVPLTITNELPHSMSKILCGQKSENMTHWAIHPGGRTILDAVQKTIGMPADMLRHSRDVLRRFGNMSSATVMFVLNEMLQPGTKAGLGCAMAFGPGLTAESMLFQTAANV